MRICEAELILGIWGEKANLFQGAEKCFSGIWGTQCIIFREQGITDPPPPPGASTTQCGKKLKITVCESLSLSHWYPGSGVVLDCIDS